MTSGRPMNEELTRHLLGSEATVVEALDAINRLSGESMTLFVTEGDNRLVGTLTDGDIRRALLSGHTLTDSVGTICHRDCFTLPAGHGTTISACDSIRENLAKARQKGIVLLPVVDANGRIINLIDLRKQRGIVPVTAVLMAGGIGERLRPLTQNTPKPMLPVGGKPIIDHNIGLMRSFGIERILVSVNYLKDKIKNHLGSSAEVIEEPFKMGTIGSLSLLPDNMRSDSILVMNADLLTDIDLESLYRRHMETDAWMTMATVPYAVSVPFAIVEHSGDRITGLTEKPTYNYYANAGIYMLRREAVEMIPSDRPTDATDLAERLLGDGKRVSLFPIEGRWFDIGSPDDYRHACEMA